MRPLPEPAAPVASVLTDLPQSSDFTGTGGRDYAAIAHGYARQVASGEIKACKWIRLACERHLRDLETSEADGSAKYLFDAARARKACVFIESLPHIEGKWARAKELLRLEPWQCWIVCSVFGWIHRETGLRRFREAYVCVPRKNGKSALSAGIALYMLAADGEFGAQVYTGATCLRQAMYVFGPAKKMVQSSPRIRELFGIRAGKVLSIAATGSAFEPLIGDPGDGSGPSCAVIDEYHEHRSNRLVDSMVTGMGAREHPLLWVITTAGVDTAGPCRSYQGDAERMLEGKIEREDLFAAIYTIDAGDDWTSLEAARKANPNWGVSVNIEVIAKNLKAALQSSRLQNNYKTKHLNVWVGANVSWMNMARWRELADPALNPRQLRGAQCVGMSDLSSKLDLAGSVIVFRRRIENLDHYYAFCRAYLPAERLKDPESGHFEAWAMDGHLTPTPGNVIDYATIEEDALEDTRTYKIGQWGFDPWNAEEFAQHLAKKSKLQAVEVPQTTRYLSEPMKHLEALVIDGRFHHDGHPVLEYCMGNIVAHTDHKGNVFPNKEGENKIDLGVALIGAMRLALAGGRLPSVYKTRGIRTL